MKKSVIGLCLLSSLCANVSFAESVESGVVKTDYSQLNSLYKNGEFNKLQEQLSIFNANDNQDMEVLFFNGLLNSHVGNYKEATKYFRKMLEKDPSLIRPRLELALSLQNSGDYVAAKYNYEQALSTRLPQDAVDKIYQKLGEIRTKLPVYNFSLSMISDSNPQRISYNKVVYINGLPYTLNNSNVQTKYGVLATGDAHIPMSFDTSLYLNAYAEIKEFSGKNIDSMYGQVSFGKSFVKGEDTLTGEVGTHISSYAGKKQSDGLFVSMNGFKRLNDKTGVNANVSYKTYDYQDYDFLNGSLSSINVTGLYVPDQTSRVEASIGVSNYNAKESSYSYVQPSYSIRYMKEFGGGWLTGVKYSGLNTEYKSDDVFFGIKRNDFENRVELELSNRKFIIGKFIPKVSFGYSKVDSNIDAYSYDRKYLNIGFSSQF